MRPPEQEIAKNLGQAIERLQEDIARVELWAAALSCFVQPVPTYSPNDEYLLVTKKPTDSKPFD
jgi:hypothetical protein